MCLQLTKVQDSALKKINHFLDSDLDCFILKGYAGTGKTTLIREVAKLLNPNEFKLMCPTGRASRILQEKTGITSSTIHSAIYYLVEDKHDGDELESDYLIRFEIKHNDDESLKLIIVDEASMLGNNLNEHDYIKFGSGKLLSDLINYALKRSEPAKILFVGDPAQLSPVNSKLSPALSEKYLLEKFELKSDSYELTEVIRQEEGSVLDFATDIRNKIKNRNYNDLDVGEGLLIKKYEDDTEFLSSYHKAKNKILVAYDNASVINFNKRYRQEFLQLNDELSEGEKLIVVSNNYLYDLFNGDFIEVTKVYPGKIKRKIKFKVKENDSVIEKEILLSFTKISFRRWKEDFEPQEAYILDNILYDEVSSVTKDIYRALVVNFNIMNPNLRKNTEEYKEKLIKDPYINSLKVKYGYAITCHKAQGGEWKNVFIYTKFIKSVYSEEYLRWLYTAVTRSSKHLALLDFRPLSLTCKTEIADVLTGETGIITIDNEYIPELASKIKDESIRRIASILIKKLNDESYEIELIKEGKYFIRFFLKNSSYFDVYYNGKFKLTSIRFNYLISKGVQKNIIDIFEKVKGKSVAVNVKEKEPFHAEYSPIEKIIIDLLNKFCEKYNYKLFNIERKNWHLRFFLLKNSERATINIWYNGKGLIKRVEPLEKKSSSSELLAEVLNNFQVYK